MMVKNWLPIILQQNRKGKIVHLTKAVSMTTSQEPLQLQYEFMELEGLVELELTSSCMNNLAYIPEWEEKSSAWIAFWVLVPLCEGTANTRLPAGIQLVEDKKTKNLAKYQNPLVIPTTKDPQSSLHNRC